MKELRNNVDREIAFTSILEAKHYYLPSGKYPCSKEDYLEDDYERYCNQFLNYRAELEQCETLEELADILNKYTDIFSDGRINKVVEI